MKRVLSVLVIGATLLAGCSNKPAPIATPTVPAPSVSTVKPSAAPSVPSVIPSAHPSKTASFPPMDEDAAFLAAMRTSGPTGSPDYVTWRKVDDKTLTDLGHNVAGLFVSYGGVRVCVDTPSVKWGETRETDNCEEALYQTVAFLDRASNTAGVETTHLGNSYLVGAAAFAYLPS